MWPASPEAGEAPAWAASGPDQAYSRTRSLAHLRPGAIPGDRAEHGEPSSAWSRTRTPAPARHRRGRSPRSGRSRGDDPPGPDGEPEGHHERASRLGVVEAREE